MNPFYIPILIVAGAALYAFFGGIAYKLAYHYTCMDSDDSFIWGTIWPIGLLVSLVTLPWTKGSALVEKIFDVIDAKKKNSLPEARVRE